MINILIPLAGKNTFKTDKNNAFPKILTDVGGKLLIERSSKPFTNISLQKNIVIALPKKESEAFRLDKVLPLLDEDITICHINGHTQGAACSALLAVESLDLNSPLIISSFEQVLDFDLEPYIEDFIENEVDAGVLTFEAIHPKWSYVKICDQNWVKQAAEKMPISKNAIAGFYFFKTANIFVSAAQAMIRKGVKTNELFYIAPVLNEIILQEGKVKALPIDKTHYYHINDEHSLESFEESIICEAQFCNQDIANLTAQYVEAFNSMNIESIKPFFTDDFLLTDPTGSIKGLDDVINYIDSIFTSVNSLQFKATNIFVSSDYQSIIEFELVIDGKHFVGTDVIKWNSELKMLNMNAYLYEKNNG
jgi:dTDP-glucose pyrophosphorylase